MAPYLQFLGLGSSRRAKYVSDMLPWAKLVAPGVIETKDKALQRIHIIRGKDIVGETRESQGARMMQANDVLKRLGGKWMLQSEAQRTRVTTYPDTVWRLPVAGLIDEERRRTILDEPGARETRYYLTLTWQPPQAAVQQARRLVVANLPEEEEVGDEALQRFVAETDYLMELLQSMMAYSEPCTTDETLTYLHTILSDRWHPVRWSGHALDIDTQLADTPYLGGWYPQLGDWHLRTCSFVSYPATSHVGMVRQLETLDLDFRWCTRWLGLDRVAQQGVLQRSQYAWVQQEKHFFARIGEGVTGREARVIDSDARNKAEQTDAARQEVGADILAIGEFTSTITVWDTDPQRAKRKLETVRQAFEGQGFVLQPETFHSEAAWLSTHPGNRHSSVRKSKQSSLFLAHFLPGLQACWAGPTEDAYLHGAPWYLAHTDTSSIFRVTQHVRDVGHSMTLGVTGSGKSVKLAFEMAQWFARYMGVQGFWWDLGRSARLTTLLLGGHWYELGSPGMAFQPLRRVDDPAQRMIALQWLTDRVEDAGYPATGVVHACLENNLKKVGALPVQKRTISALSAAISQQINATNTNASAGKTGPDGISRPDMRLEAVALEQFNVNMALKPYTTMGEFGWLFDADHDDLADGPLHTFEQAHLLSIKRLVRPVTSYVFHQIEQRFSTETPTFMPMDEAAITATLPGYAEKYDEWLMTLRKKGVALAFQINALHQVSQTRLGLMLQDNCPTRYFLPNSEATSPNIRKVYEDFGLTSEEIAQIAQARPTRDVYYSCVERGKRMFHLPLTPFILDCVARNTEADHALMDALLAKEGREGFAEAWMRHHGYEDAAKICAQRRTA